MDYQQNNAQQTTQGFQGYNYGVNPSFPFNGGMMPNQAQPPKMGNWLTSDKLSLLQKGAERFNLSVSETDVARGQCNHYYQNGQPALLQDADGSGGCTCQICGTHFTTKDYTPAEVSANIEETLDILNTIKICYLSIDPHAACDFFQIIPFIEKIPKLYEVAMNDFRRYEGIDGFVQGPNQNPFNIFGMMTTPSYGAPMYGQQMYTQPQGYAQPNPAMNPMYGQYGQPQAPVYGQQPQMNGYVPQNNGFAMNSQGAAAPAQSFNPNMPVQPSAPTQSATPNVAPTPAQNSEVKVDTQFKA